MWKMVFGENVFDKQRKIIDRLGEDAIPSIEVYGRNVSEAKEKAGRELGLSRETIQMLELKSASEILLEEDKENMEGESVNGSILPQLCWHSRIDYLNGEEGYFCRLKRGRIPPGACPCNDGVLGGPVRVKSR